MKYELRKGPAGSINLGGHKTVTIQQYSIIERSPASEFWPAEDKEVARFLWDQDSGRAFSVSLDAITASFSVSAVSPGHVLKMFQDGVLHKAARALCKAFEEADYELLSGFTESKAEKKEQ